MENDPYRERNAAINALEAEFLSKIKGAPALPESPAMISEELISAERVGTALEVTVTLTAHIAGKGWEFAMSEDGSEFAVFLDGKAKGAFACECWGNDFEVGYYLVDDDSCHHDRGEHAKKWLEVIELPKPN
jgi:hypothetical protein